MVCVKNIYSSPRIFFLSCMTCISSQCREWTPDRMGVLQKTVLARKLGWQPNVDPMGSVSSGSPTARVSPCGSELGATKVSSLYSKFASILSFGLWKTTFIPLRHTSKEPPSPAIDHMRISAQCTNSTERARIKMFVYIEIVFTVAQG